MDDVGNKAVMALFANTGNSFKLYQKPINDKCVYLRIFGFKGASISKVIGARNERMMDDYDGQMIFGDRVGLKLPDIRLTGEDNPEKNLTKKLVPTGDRTLARCVTGAYATARPTASVYNSEP